MQQKIIGLAIAMAFCVGLYFIGHFKGYADAQEDHYRADIDSLNKSIVDLNAATKAAGAANLVLHKTISEKQKADNQSTQAFKNAINSTAHLRFNCVFDDSIMQQLYGAADRADKAAASGINYAMPASAKAN